MAYLKRVAVCTVLGLLAGLICYFGGAQAGVVYTNEMIASTILNRALLGFVIGISCWRINYLLHGALLGLFVTLPVSVFSGFGANMMTLFGVLYGVVIELASTKLLSAPMGACCKK
ncbi:MAG: hypothetical protein ABIH99_04995 [Candidatus Micrarchaeota archaeon]